MSTGHWYLSGFEFHVSSNDHTITNVSNQSAVERISGAVNAAYESLEQHTRISSRWPKPTLYPCMLASDYRSSVETKCNLFINNIRSDIESWLSSTPSPYTFELKLIYILNSAKLSTVLTHYGLYGLALDIHKLTSRDPSRPTPPHMMECIAATEQFELMSPDFFKWNLSVANAFSVVTINNEFHHHSDWMTEQIFYRFFSSMLIRPKEYNVKSRRNNHARRYHKAMFRKLQFYHELDGRHGSLRVKRIVFGYFRKHSRLISNYHIAHIPPLAMYITWTYYDDHSADDVHSLIGRIPQNVRKMEAFCSLKEYRNIKMRHKYLRRYYGAIHCNDFGSFQLEDEWKCDLLAVLGFLMISNAKCISEILESESSVTLHRKLSAFWRRKSMAKCFELNELKLKLLSKQLLRCDVEWIESVGIDSILAVYGNADCGVKDVGEDGPTVHVVVGGERTHYIVAECLRFCMDRGIELDIDAMVDGNAYFVKPDEGRWRSMSWSERMEYGIMFHFACSCLANSLYLRVLSLLKLTRICHEKGYYLLGVKCLKCAHSLCLLNGQLLPSFVGDGYRKWRRRFKRMSRRIRCGGCGQRAKEWRSRTCSQCMRYSYCSTKCQAVHWEKGHRDECLSSWLTVYRMLETRLFSRSGMASQAKGTTQIEKGGRCRRDQVKYPRTAVIDGRLWTRCHSKREKKHFWKLDPGDGTNVMKKWDPWTESGRKAPWMKTMGCRWNKFQDDDQRPYWYDYQSKKSTYCRPKDYESDQDIPVDSCLDTQSAGGHGEVELES